MGQIWGRERGVSEQPGFPRVIQASIQRGKLMGREMAA